MFGGILRLKKKIYVFFMICFDFFFHSKLRRVRPACKVTFCLILWVKLIYFRTCTRVPNLDLLSTICKLVFFMWIVA